ncbi:MAG: ATP-binding protein [Defluviicoccus sp.]|nr:ATP-binding protein [Defluviicoccus sp.]
MTDGSGDTTIEIALENDLRKIARVAARIEEFCSARGIAPNTVYAVNLAIDELLTNTIGHGYDDDEPHRIEVIVRLEENTLVVAIVDDSAPFDPTDTREPDIDALIDGRETDGLGMLLVNRTMDRVEYRRQNGCNVVTLTKNATG